MAPVSLGLRWSDGRLRVPWLIGPEGVRGRRDYLRVRMCTTHRRLGEAIACPGSRISQAHVHPCEVLLRKQIAAASRLRLASPHVELLRAGSPGIRELTPWLHSGFLRWRSARGFVVGSFPSSSWSYLRQKGAQRHVILRRYAITPASADWVRIRGNVCPVWVWVV